MDIIATIWADLSGQFLDPRKRLFIGYLMASLVIALVWMCVARRHSPGTAFRTFFAKEVWISRSSRQDVICFMLNRVLFCALAPVLVTQLAIATLIFHLLHQQDVVALGVLGSAGYWIAAGSFTVFFFLLDDFSRFALHLALHRIPWLWAFHKFHHSAETLTPLTVTRTHPVEGLLFTVRSSLVQGISIALFVFLFGNQVDLLTVFGVNIFLFAFNALGSNLRHSHVAIRYPACLERVLMSPAQHQLHHSDATRHYDRNFGVALSVWDRIFGSFHHSVTESMTFGIGPETANFTKSVWSMYWSPFRDVLSRCRRLLKGRPASWSRHLFSRRESLLSRHDREA